MCGKTRKNQRRRRKKLRKIKEEDETHEINFLWNAHARHTQVNVNIYECRCVYVSMCPFYCHLMSYISKRCPSTLWTTSHGAKKCEQICWFIGPKCMTNYKLCVLCYVFVYNMNSTWRKRESKILWCLEYAMAIDLISCCNLTSTLYVCAYVRVRFILTIPNPFGSRCVPQPLFGHVQRSASSILYLLIPTVPTRYCLEFCPVHFFELYLLQITFQVEKRIAFAAQNVMGTKCHGYCEYTRNSASLCNFLHFVCFATCNWRRQTFEFPRWLHVYIASIDWNGRIEVDVENDDLKGEKTTTPKAHGMRKKVNN